MDWKTLLMLTEEQNEIIDLAYERVPDPYKYRFVERVSPALGSGNIDDSRLHFILGTILQQLGFEAHA